MFVQVGEDVFVSEFAKIKRPNLVKVGNHVAIDECTITTAMELGDYIHICPYVSVVGGIDGYLRCEGFNNIMAGAGIICVSDSFDESGLPGALIPYEYRNKLVGDSVVLEPFVNVGTNAVILPGSHLAMGTLVTVGSVFRGTSKPWTKYRGNPAKPYAEIDGSVQIQYAKEMGYEF